ncbi:MAG: hypothetical protein HY400_05185 [Elusimicrobia bacterium]|nr:hypothetical protein [Elusimicrobiota bacterium]
MNTKRVVIGGVVAGLVMMVIQFIVHVGILGSRWELMTQLGHLKQPGNIAFLFHVGLPLCVGLVLAYLYAAVRPRLGPGPATAVKVGAAGWVLVYWSWVGIMFLVEVYGLKPPVVMFVTGLFECAVGALVAGKIYQE